MKVLLDTSVWGAAKHELQAAGHDAWWTGDLAEDPGDEEILAQAHREQPVLVTLDKDFGELAVRRGLPHCGIVRLVNIRAQQQAAVCLQVLARFSDDLGRCAIITAEAGLYAFGHLVLKNVEFQETIRTDAWFANRCRHPTNERRRRCVDAAGTRHCAAQRI